MLSKTFQLQKYETPEQLNCTTSETLYSIGLSFFKQTGENSQSVKLSSEKFIKCKQRAQE